MTRDEILKKSSEIRRFILQKIETNPTGITRAIVDQFEISRQAATRYITQMVADGQLNAKGSTKDRTYSLGKTIDFSKEYDLTMHLDESEIWSKDFKNLCGGVQENIMKICAYGFTEMVNNAIDHSNGKILWIWFKRTPAEIKLVVQDDGIGIFRKIKEAEQLSDERQAILELSKGKLTTDPEKHTGQGIFFTSRAFDYFTIDSHDLIFSHKDTYDADYLFSMKKTVDGTSVHMEIKLNSKKNLTEIFNEFSDPKNDYTFDKTVVPVQLVQYEGEDLISRSQAKRLMIRVDHFRRVLLDFEGIKSVGPAFADEIFRVYKLEHPNITLTPINASTEVMNMIQRAKANILDGNFQHINNVDQLIAEGLIELSGVGHSVGFISPGGELAPPEPSYRIAKRDSESIRKTLPHLSGSDQQKIKTVLDLE